jgi:hypothetical protein
MEIAELKSGQPKQKVLLTMFLQGKGPRSTDTVTSAVQPTTTSPTPVSGRHPVPAMIKRLARNDAVRTVVGLLIVGALVALALVTIYYVGPNGFPTVQHHRIYKPQTADLHHEAFRGDAPGSLRVQIQSTVEPSDLSATL